MFTRLALAAASTFVVSLGAALLVSIDRAAALVSRPACDMAGLPT